MSLTPAHDELVTRILLAGANEREEIWKAMYDSEKRRADQLLDNPPTYCPSCACNNCYAERKRREEADE